MGIRFGLKMTSSPELRCGLGSGFSALVTTYVPSFLPGCIAFAISGLTNFLDFLCGWLSSVLSCLSSFLLVLSASHPLCCWPLLALVLYLWVSRYYGGSHSICLCLLWLRRSMEARFQVPAFCSALLCIIPSSWAGIQWLISLRVARFRYWVWKQIHFFSMTSRGSAPHL